MSEKKLEALDGREKNRAEAAELNDEALEQVSGGEEKTRGCENTCA